MNEWFKLKERGSSVPTEIIAGITTFITMVYITIVNPAILSKAGMDFHGVFVATIIATMVGTLIMGVFANLPIAIAPGMGVNAYFTFLIVTLFDTTGTMIGVSEQAGLMKDGKFPRVKSALLAAQSERYWEPVRHPAMLNRARESPGIFGYFHVANQL